MTDADWFDDGCTRSGCSSPATRCGHPARAASSCATRRSCSGSTRTTEPGKVDPAAQRVGARRRGRAQHRRHAPGRRAARAPARSSCCEPRSLARAARGPAAPTGRAGPWHDGSSARIVDPGGHRRSAVRVRQAGRPPGRARRARPGAGCCGSDPDGVAERTGLRERDGAVEPVPAGLVGLGELRATRRACRRARPRAGPGRARPARRRRRGASSPSETKTLHLEGLRRPPGRRRRRRTRRGRSRTAGPARRGRAASTSASSTRAGVVAVERARASRPPGRRAC